MTRRTAAERHLDSAPRAGSGHGVRPTSCADAAGGLPPPDPALAGRAARRSRARRTSGSSPAAPVWPSGSVSHHLKVLHRQDLIEPAPELARDTRESWWRSSPPAADVERRRLRRRAPLGAASRRRAEAENFRLQVRAMQDWLRRAHEVETAGWRTAASSTDTYVPATASAAARTSPSGSASWSPSGRRECLDDRCREPGRGAASRSAAIARAFPSEPVRP